MGGPSAKFLHIPCEHSNVCRLPRSRQPFRRKTPHWQRFLQAIAINWGSLRWCPHDCTPRSGRKKATRTTANRTYHPEPRRVPYHRALAVAGSHATTFSRSASRPAYDPEIRRVGPAHVPRPAESAVGAGCRGFWVTSTRSNTVLSVGARARLGAGSGSRPTG